MHTNFTYIFGLMQEGVLIINLFLFIFSVRFAHTSVPSEIHQTAVTC